MSHHPSPRHTPPKRVLPRHKATPPRRVAAVGGAAAVTVLTLGGALGIIPGAAMGNTSTHNPRGDSAAVQPGGDTSGSSGASGANNGSGNWLTVEPRGHNDSGGDNQKPPTSTTPPTTDESLPAGSGHGKRIVFDQSDQRVWLVGGQNKVVRTYLVSGSKYDNLQPGRYEVYSKSPTATSFDDGGETMKYMVRFAQGVNAPIGFHDIPVLSNGDLAETRSQLGTPLSAGCVRQWRPDAKALWNFAPVGTAVTVIA